MAGLTHCLRRTKRTGSSSRWLQRQSRDPYALQARQEDLRSRAAFKLKEMQEKHNLIQPGFRVIDLGCAPGGWSVVAARWVGPRGRVVGVDLLEMEPIEGVTTLIGDFADEVMQLRLVEEAGGRIDAVLSDMAPSFTGDHMTDHLRTMALCHNVLDFAVGCLRPCGSVLMKFLKGRDDRKLVARAKDLFKEVNILKPATSRSESTESYLLMRVLKPDAIHAPGD